MIVERSSYDRYTVMLIDCDIHVTYSSIKELAPYTPGNEECIERNQRRLSSGSAPSASQP